MNKPEVLVIDDEVEVCSFFEYYLREERNYSVVVAYSGEQARKLIQSKKYDLALVDLKLPDTDGITLLKEIKDVNPDCEVVIITGYSTIKSAVEAMKMGAFDYLEKPFDELEELDHLLDRIMKSKTDRQLYISGWLEKVASEFGIILSNNSPLKDLLFIARKVANKRISVLINGETGTGKELVARFIHANSFRAKQPFLAINCGALAENLLESELFGHEKGAFTGAQGDRRGIFELTDGGTLFLDEIGEATPGIQVKLLRVLEKGEFYRVGGERPIRTDVRIIAATNKNLWEAVKEKKFREDLMYRLDVISLEVPPLRERHMDIAPLTKYFINKNLSQKVDRKDVKFNEQAMELLVKYQWPGNVRELNNVVTRAMALRNSDTITPVWLPEHIVRGDNFEMQLESVDSMDDIVHNYSQQLLFSLLRYNKIDLNKLKEILDQEVNYIAQEIIKDTLEKAGHDRSQASKLLNISLRTLRYICNERGK